MIKIVHHLSSKHLTEIKPIANEFLCNIELISISVLKDAVTSIDVRQQLFNNGINDATNYIESKLI